MATTKQPETNDRTTDAVVEDTTTTETKERKPRMSRLERLKKELAEAKAKEIERVQKKHAGIQAKLENKLAQLAKIQGEINELKAELDQARNEMPIVTDGIGDVPQPEPEFDEDDEDDESDETDEDDGVYLLIAEKIEDDESDETDEAKDPAEA